MIPRAGYNAGVSQVAETALQNRLKPLVEGLKRYGALKIILFGSAARGTADVWSDLDVIVIKPSSRGFIDRLAEVVPFIPRDFPAVDVLVYTPEEIRRMLSDENPFLTRAMADGKVLYET